MTDAISYLNDFLGQKDLFPRDGQPLHPDLKTSFQLSPQPLAISQEEYQAIERLGPALLAFYRAANVLYSHCVKELQPQWVLDYFDHGKRGEVIDTGRASKFKGHVPAVIRPDLLMTGQGMVATELDAVPGGIGLTTALCAAYEELGFELAGGKEQMLQAFAAAMLDGVDADDPFLAVAVSDESADYRGEMRWLCEQLGATGLEAEVIGPWEVELHDSRERRELCYQDRRIDVVYRFFELFDLPNIPKQELIFYAARKGMCRVTPPGKTYLEEKFLFALYQHPQLQDFWQQEISQDDRAILDKLFPSTWIMDPRPVPPHAVIPGLYVGEDAVRSWQQVRDASGGDRPFVLKPSGYSELAWGSRGLAVGQDLPNQDWADAVDNALASFDQTPYILQEFKKARHEDITYYDFNVRSEVEMDGRARLCPYYFVEGDEVQLGGIMATVVPADKKAIHGMSEGVMMPVMVNN